MVQLLALCVAWALSAPSSGRAGDVCAVWPGEPEPLPTVAESDPVRARWAELRVAELTERARGLEATAAIESYLLWRRILCLQPGSLEARLGAARTRPVRIYRAAVVPPQAGRELEEAPGDDPWVILAAPVSLSPLPKASEAAERAAQRKLILAEIAVGLDEAEARLREAQFEAALESAEAERSRLARMRRGSDLRAPTVRLEVLTATAQIALGDGGGASASLERALSLQPDLALDPRRTSPKVLRALDAVRTAAESQP